MAERKTIYYPTQRTGFATETRKGIVTRSLQHNTCNRPPGKGPAIKIKGEKISILNSREADIRSTLVLRDAASTYITTYSQVISTEEGKGKNHSN
jgi:hypothetical protein